MITSFMSLASSLVLTCLFSWAAQRTVFAIRLQLFLLSEKITLGLGEYELGGFICALTRSLGDVFCDHHTWDSYLDVMPVLASLSNNSN